MTRLLHHLFALISDSRTRGNSQRHGNSTHRFLKVAAFVVAGLSLVSNQKLFGETTNLPGYFTRVWNTEEGLPNDAVTAVVQTRDGYLWLATYDGLVRFDGVT